MRRSVSLFVACLLAVLAFAMGLGLDRARDALRDLRRSATPQASSADLPPGIWQRAPPELLVSGEQMERMRRLANLPYLDGYEAPSGAGGVTVHDAAKSYGGLNLVVSAHAPEAALMDMQGTVLHTWRRAMAEVWPDLETGDREVFPDYFRRAWALPGGELIAIFDRVGMLKLDRDSKLLWANAGGYHHDLDVAPDGTIYTLARARTESHERFPMKGPIEEDFVAILSPEGRELRRVSVLDAFLDSDYQSVLAGARSEGDVLHVNTIERMDGRFSDRHPLFAKDRLLPPAAEGDLFVIHDTGAHAHSMGFQYNGKLRAPEILRRRDGSFELIRERETVECLFANTRMPERRQFTFML